MLAFLAMVTVLLAFNHDTRIVLYVSPVWIVGIVIGYFVSRKHHVRLAPEPAVAATTAHDHGLPSLADEDLVPEPQIALETATHVVAGDNRHV